MFRSRRRALVVWRGSAVPRGPDAAPRFTRARRIRRSLRTGALLTVVGLTPLARALAGRWRILLPGAVLTVTGIFLRGGPVGVVLLPGLLLLFSAPLVPVRPEADRTRRSALARELAGYSTPAQLRDLEAILNQYPDEMTRELRDILAGQRLIARNKQFPAIGRY